MSSGEIPYLFLLDIGSLYQEGSTPKVELNPDICKLYLDYRTAFLGQRLERGGPWPVQASKSRAGKIRQVFRKGRTSLSLAYHSVVVQDADTILIHSNPHQSALLRRQLGRLQKQKKPIRPTVRDSESKYFLRKKVCPEGWAVTSSWKAENSIYTAQECCGRRHLALGLCHPTPERWRASHLPARWVENSE